MAQGGSTMGEEPGWGELLGAFVLVASIPVVVGGALICALVGLSVWVSSAVRRRRTGGGGGTEAVCDPNGPA
ncbi:hypothetical protein ACFXGG_29200 [Streptomyces nigra]|uniref:hypothetical protein n=2 Tax=Streptomyces TaxID=1883 RepID=UPI001F2F15FB|nr:MULTISPECIES: hypothetical protein [Streptomyces]MCF2540840.1 hypothetical protein [Streptomyces sp. FB2]